ncbi:Ldh family oxidoreductase [Pseudomonas aeruginosa]|nr:Ldh family oxidoreductase [Pseudomonas aeruginosa]
MTLDEVRELAVRILRRHAFSEAHVQAVADTLVAGERDECASHGIWRLLGCIATLKAGKVSADAEPELRHRSRPAAGRRPWRVLPSAHSGWGCRICWRRPAARASRRWR